MGDFLLDCRPRSHRVPVSLVERIGLPSQVQEFVISEPDFDLRWTIPDSTNLWGHYRRSDGSRTIVLVGRITVEDRDLEKARPSHREGGLVCHALDEIVSRSGVESLTELGGNFVLILHDRSARTLHLITDCTGVFPAYEAEGVDGPVFASHPDVLAGVAPHAAKLDDVSIAEFVLTGTVSPPHTYYQGIRAVGRATWLTLIRQADQTLSRSQRCYFPLEFRGNPKDHEDDVAEEFAQAFRRAVQLRSRRSMGRCAIALSGGLDSRLVLASLDPSADTFAFTCYDEPNLELRSAKAIADAAGVRFLPFQRPPDYYGENAKSGVRIAGGMGSFANNHFLGVLPWLQSHDASTLLTGCYCDYLFKGLPLNRRTSRFTGKELLAPFKTEFYFSHTWPDTPLARQAKDRIQARYPANITQSTSAEDVFRLETLRTFPLCYEGDNCQRLIPQRLAGWFPPISDVQLMRVYCRIPYHWKLNRSLFKKAVNLVCDHRFDQIPDANTGAPVKSSRLGESFHNLVLLLGRQIHRIRPSLATDGSWPNWRYYAAHSSLLSDLWDKSVPASLEIAGPILGHHLPQARFGRGSEAEMWLQVQLLTLGLWWGQRVPLTPTRPVEA